MIGALFAGSLLFLIYVLYGYSILLRFILWLKSKPLEWNSNKKIAPLTPFVSIVVPCFNEESNISRKIQNIYSTAYNKDLFEVIFIDNDSTDGTLSLLTKESKNFPVTILRSRRGKIFALNEALKLAKGEYVIATDADTSWEEGAMGDIVNAFTNETIGAVCATPFIQNALDHSKEKFHLNDWVVRDFESRLDSCSSLDGRLMAFRRNIIGHFPENSAVDDLELTMILRRKGYYCLVLPNVLVKENSPENWRQEFSQIRRRVYTVFLSLWNHKKMIFNPAFGYYGLLILPSRRLFPLFLPFAAVLSLFTGLILWPKTVAVMVFLASLKFFLKKEIFPVLQFFAIFTGWFDIAFSRHRGDTWCRTD